jgi:AraC-like DNA-binding protein
MDRCDPLQNKARFWTDVSLDGLELLYADYQTQEFAPHTHDSYAIGVVHSGALSFRPKSPSDVVPSGNIMIIHPGEVHTGRCVGVDGCKYRMFYVQPTFLLDLHQHLSGKSVQSLFFQNQNIKDNNTAKLLHSLHAAIEKSKTPTIQKESRLIEAMTHLLVRHGTPRPYMVQETPNRKYVRIAKEFIEVHYKDNLTLREIARAVNISPFHLLRMFKAEIGLAPHAYLTQYRIRKARHFLSKGTPIVQVALRTGFCDQSQFTKRFKQLVGTTPGQFRNTEQ